jgi:hypothetical protein
MSILQKKNLYKFALISTIFISGCSSNHYSIHRVDQLDPDESAVISVDAKQRLLLSNVITKTVEATPASSLQTVKTMTTEKIRRYCTEPSPDVFSVLSQAASGSGSFGQTADPKSINIALQAAFSISETGSTIQRTQTINMLKEMMYRTCERYLNGQIGDYEYPIIAARDQRIMTSILAIEQLTGTLTPKLSAIAATGSASTGQSTNDAILSLDNADKKVTEKKNAFDTAQKEFVEIDKPEGSCAILMAKKTDTVTTEEAPTLNTCNEKKENKEEAEQEFKEAKIKYDTIVNLVGKPGASSATTSGILLSTSAATETDKQIEQIRSQTIQNVASVVKDIVEKSFNQDDETAFFCYRVIEKNANNVITASCNNFIVASNNFNTASINFNAARIDLNAAKVDSETARLKAEIEKVQVFALEMNKVVDKITTLTPEQALIAEKSLPAPTGYALEQMKKDGIEGTRSTNGTAAKKALRIRAINSDSNNELNMIATAVRAAMK